MLVKRKVIKELEAAFSEAYLAVGDELVNSRTVETNYLTADLMEINKPRLIKDADALISVLNQLKELKEFNPETDK